MSLTEDQIRAIDPTASVVVSASAGTGKTHVLTARLLRLLLNGADPRAILCLTFTKAAAAEMINRVYGELGRWTRMDDHALTRQLHDRLGLDADAEMLVRARRLFAQIVDLPTGLEIQTFHGFCQSLLKRFPLEAALAPQFKVADDGEAADLAAKAREAILEQPSPELEEALAVLAVLVSEEGFAELVQTLLHHRPDLSALFDQVRTGDVMDAELARMIDSEPGADEAALTADAVAGIAVTDLDLLHEAFISHGGKGEQQVAPLLRQDFPAWETVFLTGDGSIRKNRPTKALIKAIPESELAFMRVAQTLVQLRNDLAKARLLRHSRAVLTLGRALMEDYGRAKDQAGVLDYDDLILRTRNLLKQEAISPWILYKLDAGLEHVLIDEAQDTNPQQWAVVRQLWEDFFSGLGTRDEDAPPRTVFLVGDAKQSIFGFQGADPTGLAAARTDLADQITAAEQHFQDVPLNLSFRSTEAVLGLVDAVFEDPGLRQGLGVDEVVHQASRAGQAGRIELWPLVMKQRTRLHKTGHRRWCSMPDRRRKQTWRIGLPNGLRRRSRKADQLPPRAVVGCTMGTSWCCCGSAGGSWTILPALAIVAACRWRGPTGWC